MDRCRLINYFRVQVVLRKRISKLTVIYIYIARSYCSKSEIVSVKYEPAEKSAVTEKVSF